MIELILYILLCMFFAVVGGIVGLFLLGSLILIFLVLWYLLCMLLIGIIMLPLTAYSELRQRKQKKKTKETC